MTTGRIIIKLKEFREGFFLQNGVLIVLHKNGTLQVCEIKEQLDVEEIILLGQDLELGLKKIHSKIRLSGPLTIINGLEEGEIYYGDLIVIKAEDSTTIVCQILE